MASGNRPEYSPIVYRKNAPARVKIAVRFRTGKRWVMMATALHTIFLFHAPPRKPTRGYASGTVHGNCAVSFMKELTKLGNIYTRGSGNFRLFFGVSEKGRIFAALNTFR